MIIHGSKAVACDYACETFLSISQFRVIQHILETNISTNPQPPPETKEMIKPKICCFIKTLLEAKSLGEVSAIIT